MPRIQLSVFLVLLQFVAFANAETLTAQTPTDVNLTDQAAAPFAQPAQPMPYQLSAPGPSTYESPMALSTVSTPGLSANHDAGCGCCPPQSRAYYGASVAPPMMFPQRVPNHHLQTSGPLPASEVPIVSLGDMASSTDIIDDSCFGDCFDGEQSLSRTFSMFGGYNWLITNDDVLFPLPKDLNEEWAAGFAIGNRIRPRIRTELEYAFRRNSGPQDLSRVIFPAVFPFTFPSNLKVDVQSVMANMIFDLPSRGQITPYVGVGIGVSHVEALVFDNTPSQVYAEVDGNTNFAFQAIGGVDLKLCNSVSLFAEYRYFGTGEVEQTSGREANLLSQSGFGGFRLRF